MSDPLKFTTIAHATHRYLSPLSDQKAAWLVDRLAVSPGSRMLDIGCGSATLLLNVIVATGAWGVGVDINPVFLERATASAHEQGVEDRVEWRCAPLKEAVQADERFDALLCLGASQAIGTFADALRWSFQALREGGVALFGDGYWQRTPYAAYLSALGATEDELTSHAGNAQLARDAGFRVLATATANSDEWDDYEGRYAASMERHLAAHPDDPDAPAMAKRIRDWHETYLRYGRETLGFGFYVLLKSSDRDWA
jgi:cyclopropane fatty-acyl-phospholipid synthase-like methyltransferase